MDICCGGRQTHHKTAIPTFLLQGPINLINIPQRGLSLKRNTPILNNAVSYINSTNGSYKVVGATDTRASEAYNQRLSERRANNVKDYLVRNGVESSKLRAEGRGERDLKYPECEPATKCPEWKNRANRRVFFEAN